MDRSIKEDSNKFYFIFSEFYYIFYGFFKFLRFSKNINENRKLEKSTHSAGPAFQLRAGIAGLARRQKWPDRPTRRGAPSTRWRRGGEVLGRAPVERGGGIEQYLIGGEGAGRRGDGEVVERAQPSGARWRRRGCSGRR
jgi:hypothetical protein